MLTGTEHLSKSRTESLHFHSGVYEQEILAICLSSNNFRDSPLLHSLGENKMEQKHRCLLAETVYIIPSFNKSQSVLVLMQCLSWSIWIQQADCIKRWQLFLLNLVKCTLKKDNSSKISNLTCASDTAQGSAKRAEKNQEHVSPGTQDKHAQLRHKRMPKIPERHGIIPGWLRASCGICSSSACPMQYLMHDIRKTLLSPCFSPQDLTYMSIVPSKCQNVF